MKMKRIITLLTAAALALTAFPVTAFAEESDTEITMETLQNADEASEGVGDIADTAEELTLGPEEDAAELTGDDLKVPEEDKDASEKAGTVDLVPEGSNRVALPEGVSGEVPFVGGSDASTAGELPAKYNVFELEKLPPVRDQLKTGTCWVHGTIGAIETDIIHDGKAGTDIDLSEMQTAYYFYNKYNDPKKSRKDYVKLNEKNFLMVGGDTRLATRQLANIVGAIPEKDAPLTEDAGYVPQDDSYIVSKDSAQIRNAYFINPTDSEGIKRAIMNHGGVTADFAVVTGKDDKGKEVYIYYDKNNNSYYSDVTGTNHTIMFVGWDDGFKKENFNTVYKPELKPEGDGAWLVRNSWGGQGYGFNGYFWLSYYDRSFTTSPVYANKVCVAFDAATDKYDNCYSYNGSPVVYEAPVKKDDTVTVEYKVAGKEAVKGASFEIATANAKVKMTAKNTSTGASVSGTVHTSYAGIYTVEFKKPLEVYKDSVVEVSLRAEGDDGKDVNLVLEWPEDFGIYGNDIAVSHPTVDKGFYYNGQKVSTKGDTSIRLYTNKSTDQKYTKVKSVSLDKNKASIKDGKTLKLKATVKPEDAAYKSVKWSSSDEKIATVSDKGVVQALAPGKVTITARTLDQGKKATCKVTVERVPLKDVSLKSKASVYKGKTITLKPVFKPKNASNKKVTWSSDNKKVATVDKNGVVKGKKPGKANITVKTKEGGMTATCKVTVKKPIRVSSVSLNSKSKTLNVGGKFKLKVTIKPKNATEKGVNWKSSDPKVATVDKKGNVTAKKAGKTTITATSKDNSKKKAKCTVTVK